MGGPLQLMLRSYCINSEKHTHSIELLPLENIQLEPDIKKKITSNSWANRLTIGPCLVLKSIECFLEDQAFSPSYDSVPPPPFHRPAATHRKSEKERRLADRRGGRGWVRSRVIRSQKSLVLYKSFNTLWSPPVL